MNKPKFRKLREFDKVGKNEVTILSLRDTRCVYWYENKTYQFRGIYNDDYNFLLDYYVKGIWPDYKIEQNRIIPYLRVILDKEEERQ